MKNKKRFFAALLIACLMVSNMSVLAAEPAEPTSLVADINSNSCEAVTSNDVSVNSTTSTYSNLYGYAAGYAGTELTSFYIDASGSSASNGGFTVETYSFNSNTVKIGITLYRPDGSVAVNTLITGNKKVESLSFSNAPAGRYRVGVHVYGAAQGWVGGWVFKK